jgi:hypothetical protein
VVVSFYAVQLAVPDTNRYVRLQKRPSEGVNKSMPLAKWGLGIDLRRDYGSETVAPR